MNRLPALVKREFWENKGAFRTTPLVIGGINIVLVLMFLITFNHFDNDFQSLKEMLRWVGQQDAVYRDMVLYHMHLYSSVIFTIVLAFVVFFYLLGSLYDFYFPCFSLTVT